MEEKSLNVMKEKEKKQEKKESEKEKSELQEGESREYIVPLKRKLRKTPRHKRVPKAIKILKKFIARHMKLYDRDLKKIKIDKYLNEELWFRGIKNPPNKIKIKVKREGGNIFAELAELSEKAKWKKEKEKKEVERAKKKKEEKKKEREEKKAKEKEEGKEAEKEEEEKEKATVEAGLKEAEKKAKEVRHIVKEKKVKKPLARKALEK